MNIQKAQESPQSAFWIGLQQFLPIIPGAMAFGIVYGVAAIDIGIEPIEGILMSMFMLAGASQVVTIELLKTEASLWIIILSVMLVNLRFVIYSASLTQYLKPYSIGWRMLLGYFLTDQPYALSIAYFDEHPDAPYKQWFHLGHSVMLWISWIIGSALGLFVGDFIPESFNFGFAIPLMFLALGVPAIKDWTFLIAALVASVVALIAAPLPNNLGLLLAVICGMLVGILLGDDE